MEILISFAIITLLFSGVADRNDNVFEEVKVGLVVDLSSVQGKILQTSFTLALSDFYHINNGYRTRVSLLTRGSQGDSLLAVADATDLIKNAKVEAIVGAQSLQEAKLLAAISEKVKVPVISVLMPSSLSLNKYEHFIQLTHDTTSEAKAITSLLRDFNQTSIAVIYEDADGWRESLQKLVENFQDERIKIDGIASLKDSSRGEDYIVNQLKKLINVSRSSIFVVHLSEILVSRLLRCAEKLGMMEV